MDNSRAYYARKWWGKRGVVVEWLERCGYGAENRRKNVSSRLGFAIRLPENFLCQLSSKWVTFSNRGKKGGGSHELNLNRLNYGAYIEYRHLNFDSYV